jgi:hypothetical protein
MTEEPTKPLCAAEALHSIRQALDGQRFPAETLLLSARKALAPINSALKQVDNIKAHKLPDEERHKIEATRRDLAEFKEGLRVIFFEADRSGTARELLRKYFR